MSMLKTLDADGHIAEPSAASPSSPAAPATGDVRAAAEKAILAELQRMEDAFPVATKKLETRAASAEAALAQLQKTHDELVSRHAEAQRKLELVHELRAKLDGI